MPSHAVHKYTPLFGERLLNKFGALREVATELCARRVLDVDEQPTHAIRHKLA